MLIDTSSQSWAILGFSDRVTAKYFLPVISTSDSEELYPQIKFGKTLLLFLREHFPTKVLRDGDV